MAHRGPFQPLLFCDSVIPDAFQQGPQLQARAAVGAATGSPTITGGFLITMQVGSVAWARAA